MVKVDRGIKGDGAATGELVAEGRGAKKGKRRVRQEKQGYNSPQLNRLR
jgi:hypothetical protein